MFPALHEIIARTYPGTHIAITEYNFGARHHISGGLAQADFLGILGRQRVALATWWSLGKGGKFALGAFDLYRNFDGKGGRFGSRSIHATTTDIAATSIYAATDPLRNDAMTIVAINKTDQNLTARITLNSARLATSVAVWQLTGASPIPQQASDLKIGADRMLSHPMPPFSASLLSLGAASRP